MMDNSRGLVYVIAGYVFNDTEPKLHINLNDEIIQAIFYAILGDDRCFFFFHSS